MEKYWPNTDYQVKDLLSLILSETSREWLGRFEVQYHKNWKRTQITNKHYDFIQNN